MEQNKTTIHALYEQVLNERHFERYQDLVADDFPEGAAFLASVKRLINSFPDAHWVLDDVVADSERVAVRFHWTGVQKEAYTNIPATNRTVTNTGMAVFILQGGKITGLKLETDRLGAQQALGALPKDLTLKGYVSLIDRFVVPPAGQQEFLERMALNRRFLRTQPGFQGDQAYGYTDGAGNLVCITVALWENQASVDQAKAAVQQAYQREGFDTKAMMQRLHIQMDRGLYTPLEF